MVLNRVLGGLYSLGREVDRALRKPCDLGRPVLSVGNIASGGRGKTPFTILLCRKLKERGLRPVVLTRGYGRRLRDPVRVDETTLPTLRADAAGDEALEIHLLSQATVLVGARRFENAFAFLTSDAEKGAGTVFVLDDGFQHWSIARDADLVLLAAQDRTDRLLPLGRLREMPDALTRATLVLEQGVDFHKSTKLLAPESFRRLPTAVLTTRAPDSSYRAQLEELLQAPLFVELPDHAPREALLRALAKLDRAQVLVGTKEAVKLLEASRLRDFVSTGRAEIEHGGRPFVLGYAACQLEIAHEERVLRTLFTRLAARPGLSALDKERLS
jgi:tetraacyldisaccharide-1-P 4'-kinase